MGFVQATLDNINAGYEEPFIDIDFVRSRDPNTVACAFTASCDILRIMAHGDNQEPAFVSSDGETYIALADLGVFAADMSSGVAAGAVLADGCKTGTGAWQRAIRDCYEQI